MKKAKKPLSILLSVLLVLTVLPMAFVPAFADPDPDPDPEPNYAWAYDEETQTLTITGNGALPDTVPQGDGFRLDDVIPWYAQGRHAKKLVVGEGITRIGDYNFAAMFELTEAVLPSSLTSIGACAFMYDTELASVNLPAGLAEIGEQAFCYNKLTSVALPQSLTELDYNFIFCPYLAHINLNGDLQSITESFMYAMPEDIVIPGNVESIQGMMLLNTHTVFNYSPTATISDSLYSFADTPYADVLPELVFVEAQGIKYQFLYEYGEITEAEMNDAHLQLFNDALAPYGVEFDSVDEAEAFLSESFTFRYAPRPDVQIHCLSESAEHELLHDRCIPHYLLDQGNALCEEPMVGKCGDNITWSVDAQTKTLTLSGYGSMYDYNSWGNSSPFAFYADDIENVAFVLPDGEPITYLGSYAFYGLTNLTSLDIPEGVTNVGSDVIYESGVKDLSIPASFSNQSSSLYYLFESAYHTALDSITVAADNPYLHSYNGALYRNHYNDDPYYGPALVILTNDAAALPLEEGVYAIGQYAVRYIDSLNSFTIPASVRILDYSSINELKNLQTVTIEPGSEQLQIGSGCFSECKRFTAFAVSEDDERFSVVGGVLYSKDCVRAIACPTGLTDVTVPATVTELDGYYSANGNNVERLTILNPDLAMSGIYSVFGIDSSRTLIRGYARSTAEAYAMAFGFDFEPLDGITVTGATFSIPEGIRVPRGMNVSAARMGISALITYSDGVEVQVDPSLLNFRYKVRPDYGYQNAQNVYFEESGEYTVTVIYGADSAEFTVTVYDKYILDLSEAVTEFERKPYATLSLRQANVHVYMLEDNGERTDCTNSFYFNYAPLDPADTYTTTVYGYPEGSYFSFSESFTYTVIPVTYTVELPCYVVEKNGDFSYNNWGAKAFKTKNGETVPMDEITYVYFNYYDPDGEMHYSATLDTSVPGVYTLNPYFNDDYASYNAEPIQVTVLDEEGEATFGFSGIVTEVEQFGTYPWNVTVTKTVNGETYPYGGKAQFRYEIDGQTMYDYVDTTVPAEYEVTPFVDYNGTRRDGEPFTLTVTPNPVPLTMDLSEADLTLTQFSDFLGLNGHGVRIMATVNGELQPVNLPIDYTVEGNGGFSTSVPGEYIFHPYVTVNGEEVHFDPVTVTVVALADLAEPFPVDGNVTVTLTGSEKKIFSFTPPASGEYTFYSENNGSIYLDTYLTMYTDTAYFTHNDDGNGNGQFRLTVGLTAGETYTLAVRFYNSDYAGTFSVIGTHAHQLAPVDEAEASCFTDGNIACWQCAICDKYFADENGATELDYETEVLIPAYHTLTYYGPNDATCGSDGNNEYWVCETCGHYFADENGEVELDYDEDIVIPAHHTLTYYGPNDATCVSDGNNEYWVCEICGHYFADENGETELDYDEDIVIPGGHILEPHEGAQATCTENGNLPYNECTRCHKLFVDAEATQEITDPNEVVLPAHHTLTKTDAKPATCTEPGNSEYWVCSVCGDWFSDENGTAKITDHNSVVIGAKNHNYGAWTKISDTQHQRVCANDPNHKETADHRWNAGAVTAPPTCAAKGVKTYTCADCGATRNEEIATVGHTDANGDGWCDYGCGTAVGGSQPTDPGQSSGEELCKYCHQPHTGFWGKIVGFFHNIAYFFAHLFGRM